MNLVLGTAQFGSQYGVANSRGKVTRGEVKTILSLAREAGVDTIDTAMLYGDAEQVLGAAGVNDFRVISKLPGVPHGTDDVAQWVHQAIRTSTQRLRISALDTLLLHRPEDLWGPFGEDVKEGIRKAKADGLFRRLGASLYNPADADRLPSDFREVIQGPANVLDHRFTSNDFVEAMRESDWEFHARSVFLQGLLLMNPDKRPKWFSPWTSLLQRYDLWVQELGLSRLQVCLRAVRGMSIVNRIVVGVDSPSQLEEIVHAYDGDLLIPPDQLRSDDERLLHPANWQVLEGRE